ncbi:MAG: hypothetical protein KDB79_11425, partial [Acidobacteria bacterium]|nr:hypothetical protein [Acidobacteriota bacterium]
MTFETRRKFLKQAGGAASLLFLCRTAFPFSSLYAQNKDFEMLAVGDSLVTGLGLNEKDKFISLVRNWLESQYFQGARKVNLKNKSHSGSRLFLGDDEISALKNAEKDPETLYHPEINFSFPSSKTQLDIAAREYTREGKGADD